MEQAKLHADLRTETGKGPARRLRMAGKIPSVLYGLGRNEKLVLDPAIVTKMLLEEGGRNRIYMLSGQGLKETHALVRDYQVDPVSRKLLHVDLQAIDVSKNVIVTVKLTFVGKAAGVVDGGILNIVNREVEVECLPTNIPTHIDVEVSALNIGDSIHLEDLVVPEGIKKIVHENITLVTVVPPAKEEELAPALEAAAAPEVITEKKPVEGAEGDAKGAAPAAEKKDKK